METKTMLFNLKLENQNQLLGLLKMLGLNNYEIKEENEMYLFIDLNNGSYISYFKDSGNIVVAQ